jgi:hypothetical protein
MRLCFSLLLLITILNDIWRRGMGLCVSPFVPALVVVVVMVGVPSSSSSSTTWSLGELDELDLLPAHLLDAIHDEVAAGLEHALGKAIEVEDPPRDVLVQPLQKEADLAVVDGRSERREEKRREGEREGERESSEKGERM